MSDSEITPLLETPLSRRVLMKGGAGALAWAAGGITLPFAQGRAETVPEKAIQRQEKVVWSACTVNCGSRCPLRMHVVNDEILYVDRKSVV